MNSSRATTSTSSINLTVPEVHYQITRDILSAGKHAYSEKPLALNAGDAKKLVALADKRGLKLGGAPDTFLGAGGQRVRQLLDKGAIGRVIGGTAYVMSHGMEMWHPNPAFFYQPGAGPVFDVGVYYITALCALLGPVKTVTAMASKGFEERLVTSNGPMQGKRIKVTTPTNINAILAFADGAQITLGASWDVWRHGHGNPIELYGETREHAGARPELLRRQGFVFRQGRRLHRGRDVRRSVRDAQLAMGGAVHPGELSHARRCRPGRRGGQGPRAALLGPIGRACRRGHGGDPRRRARAELRQGQVEHRAAGAAHRGRGEAADGEGREGRRRGMKTILITGAAGGVARMIRPLMRADYRLRLSDRRPISDRTADEEEMPAELTDMAAVRKAVAGVDGIVHLGGNPVEADWEVIQASNIAGCYNLFEAARLEGVKRIVFASSNHAVGFYPRAGKLGHDVTPRPDTRYGLSKAFGESLGSLYAYKYGAEVMSIRIGNVDSGRAMRGACRSGSARATSTSSSASAWRPPASSTRSSTGSPTIHVPGGTTATPSGSAIGRRTAPRSTRPQILAKDPGKTGDDADRPEPGRAVLRDRIDVNRSRWAIHSRLSPLSFPLASHARACVHYQ